MAAMREAVKTLQAWTECILAKVAGMVRLRTVTFHRVGFRRTCESENLPGKGAKRSRRHSIGLKGSTSAESDRFLKCSLGSPGHQCFAGWHGCARSCVQCQQCKAQDREREREDLHCSIFSKVIFGS